MRVCDLDECGEKHAAKGLCKKHYYAHQRRVNGKPERAPYSPALETCTHPGCTNPYLARGYCKLHYYRDRDGVPMDAPIKYRPVDDDDRREHRKDRSNQYYADTYGRIRLSAKEMLDYWGATCYLCGEPIDLAAPRRPRDGPGWEKGLQREHVIPVSAGGETSLDNVKPAHVICNMRKGVLSFE